MTARKDGDKSNLAACLSIIFDRPQEFCEKLITRDPDMLRALDQCELLSEETFGNAFIVSMAQKRKQVVGQIVETIFREATPEARAQSLRTLLRSIIHKDK